MISNGVVVIVEVLNQRLSKSLFYLSQYFGNL